MVEGMLLNRAKEMKDLTEPLRAHEAWDRSPSAATQESSTWVPYQEVTTRISSQRHYGEGKIIEVRFEGRRPASLKEWARCFWNVDVFIGVVPMFKTLFLLSALMSLL